MKSVSALLGLALLVQPSIQHVAIRPPKPDKILTPNSSEAPKGCKLLASDKGFPADDVWKASFPNGFKKLAGTEGPDWWVQATSVEDVQKAVNFARENNVRLTVISTGHDFHGREYARSGLRLDMGSLIEPTVFSNDWKCGDTLSARSVSGKLVERDNIMACKVKSKRGVKVGRSVSGRQSEWHFFEKRAGATCDSMMKLKKRQEAFSFELPPLAEAIPGYNVITPTGDHAYARIPGGMYNEMFFDQAAASGLMNLGAQHNGVSSLGGWMQAGGHNPFVHKLGMAVDSVVEIEVVTPDGKFQKVSECNNPDLFWAIRGGGGSTFGVVTAITTKVYPTFPVVVARFFVNSTGPGMMEAVAHFLQVGSKYRDEHGLQGYFYVYPGAFQSVLHMPDEFATLENAKAAVEPLMAEMEKIAGAQHIEPKYYEHKTYRDWYVAEMGSEENEETGEKFLSWYDGSDGSVPSAEQIMMNPLVILPYALEDSQRQYPADFPNYSKNKRQEAAGHSHATQETAEQSNAAEEMGGQSHAMEEMPATEQEEPAGHSQGEEMDGHSHGAVEGQPQEYMRTQPTGRTYLDSRLLSDEMVNSMSIQKLGQILNATLPRIPGGNYRGFLYGGGKQAEPAPDSVGLLPAWRDTTYHFIVNAVPGSSRHDYDIGPIAEAFPEAGAYVNEAAPGEPEWKRVFWGAHYPKLEQIKKAVDPTNVLWCSPCVGADMLTYDDERICPNPNYPQAGPAPQTYPNPRSTKGIASLPGSPGIVNPLLPIIQQYTTTRTLPPEMPDAGMFKISMGEGGSIGGPYAMNKPTYDKPAAAAPAAPAAPAVAASEPVVGVAPVPEEAEEAPTAIEVPAAAAPAPAAAPAAAPTQASGGLLGRLGCLGILGMLRSSC